MVSSNLSFLGNKMNVVMATLSKLLKTKDGCQIWTIVVLVLILCILGIFMWIYVCVYVYIYVYVFIYVYFICIYVCINIYIHYVGADNIYEYVLTCGYILLAYNFIIISVSYYIQILYFLK
jgi:hypothetical protein